MPRPTKLEAATVDAWLAKNTAWTREAGPSPQEGEALVRTFKFSDFSAALGFVVRVGLAAEKRDHHPDIRFGWGKARVLWTTHDAGGITQLDLDLAGSTNNLAPGT